ncbi:MAG TPA: CBS domain-containing protein [Candidatus Acidoferrales bacterium]|nr:CBS domain-containing protein [Candidatus Acidoferrales bacterium]
MTVGDRMTKNPVTVSPKDTLVAAQEKMRAGEFRQIPVVDQGRLIGILTDRDVRKYGRHNIVASVQSAMTEGAITATPATPLEEAAQTLLRHKIGAVPVVEQGDLVGIISTTDILQAFVDLVSAQDLKAR